MARRILWFSLSTTLSAALALTGCETGSPPAGPPSAPSGQGEPAVSTEAHDHPSEGPHHGQLIELGQDEFHAELTHDDASHTITVYLLDKKAKEPVAIGDPEIVLNLVADGQPTQVKLAAAPQQSDPAGQASRFSITDREAIEALEAPKSTGRLNVTINGKPYSGAVEHHDHSDHKH